MRATLQLMPGLAAPAGLRQKHVDTCLNEFVFRFNRRYHRKASFETLLGIAFNAPRSWDITGDLSKRKTTYETGSIARSWAVNRQPADRTAECDNRCRWSSRRARDHCSGSAAGRTIRRDGHCTRERKYLAKSPFRRYARTERQRRDDR